MRLRNFAKHVGLSSLWASKPLKKPVQNKSRPLATVIRTVILDETRMSAPVRHVFERYQEKANDGEIPHKAVRATDFCRWSYVLSLIGDRYESLLDVGIGHGQFVEAAQHSGRFRSIMGADIKRYAGTAKGSVDIVEYDLTERPPPSLGAQVVTCMECIEHIANPLFDQAVANLKTLASNRLIVTVPYAEREPLPKFHHQRFTLRRLKALFPGAQVTLFANESKIVWALVDWTPA